MKNKWASWLEQAHTCALFMWLHVPLISMCKSTCHHDTFHIYLTYVPWELEIIQSKCDSERSHCQSGFTYHRHCPFRRWFSRRAALGWIMELMWVVLSVRLVAVQPFVSIRRTLKFLFDNIVFLCSCLWHLGSKMYFCTWFFYIVEKRSNSIWL